MPKIFSATQLVLFSILPPKALFLFVSLAILFSLNEVNVVQASRSWNRIWQKTKERREKRGSLGVESGGICRCGGRHKNICQIKGLNYCTHLGQFHMSLSGPIVLTLNKTPFMWQAWKTTLAPLIIKSVDPNRPPGPATWNSLNWPWSGCAVWPQQWQHWF